MRKVLSFSAFLIIGLLLSQYLPLLAGEGYATVKIVSNILLYICLSFIMINVGREFEVDKIPLAKLCRRLLHCDGLLPPCLVPDCYLLCICAFAARILEQLGGLERESAVKPFRSSYIGRYSFHDACRYRT